jgi:hypothetical protein
MPSHPAINELRQRCHESIQVNRTMMDELADNPNVEEQQKLDMLGRLLNTSNDLHELLAAIDRMLSSAIGT